VDLPAALPDAHHVYHLFVVRVRDRERVRAELGTRGVQTAIHYSVPLHLEPAFAGLGYARGDFPNAEDAVREIVSLPMFPYLTDDEVRYVARCVAEVCHA
jgi:dTDP-4-amino-4,6-dideoxygalactose transaminase